MDIRSNGKVSGIIYNNTRYVRFSFYDEELKEEFCTWWIREPLDILTRVRERQTILHLNNEYSKTINLKR